MNEQQKNAARRALQALPYVFKLVFTLRRHDLLNEKEIALILGLSVDQVERIERITGDMIDYELTFA